MSSDHWETRKLEDVLDALIDYRGKTPRKTNSGIPLITAKIVKNGFIQEPNEFIAEEDYDSWMVRGLPEVGDIVLTTEAPLGEVAQLKSGKVALAQRIVTLRGKKGVLDNGFLKYFFQSSIGQSRLKEKETGTTVTGIKQAELRKVEIDCPPIQAQRRIASILSALDDKIELNRQTNATLEAIAQAIFKAWFVDFDFPGDTGARVESELGLMPTGWRILPIGDLFEFVVGGDWGKEEAEEDYSDFCAVIRGTDINDIRNAQIDKVPRRYVQSSKLQRRQLREGDIVFEISGGSKDQATGRNLFLTAEIIEQFIEKVIPASFCRLIRAKDLSHAVFLGTYLKIFYDAGGTWDFQLQSTGISNFQFSDFQSRHTICLPPKDILGRFRDMVMPIHRLMGENISQSIALTQIRDALLPNLMSGDIGL